MEWGSVRNGVVIIGWRLVSIVALCDSVME